MSSRDDKKVLEERKAEGEIGGVTVQSMNQRLLKTEYAVRGEVLDLAQSLQQKLNSGEQLPFSKIYNCNIGNPQKLGQQPLTFNREVLSLLLNPSLMTSRPDFTSESIDRAKEYLAAIVGGVGAYSNSQGLEIVRKEVARFISRRDGFASDPSNIFLTAGASAGVKMIYQALISPSRKDGIMVPIPQYPLYSALSTLMGAQLVGYYLDEKKQWTAGASELNRSLADAKKRGANVRAMVVINPGNPTGQCLSLTAQQEIVRFCVRNSLVLLADEVYQENVYAKDKRFTSFKKVALSMGIEASSLQLVSFHSVSKGFIGECGLRGGYMELHNFPASVVAQIRKLASISLCPNTIGQVSVGLMVRPPVKDSKALYETQRAKTLASLERRANKFAAALNAIDGITCNRAEGAMYLFPRVELSPGAIAESKRREFASPDTYYCFEAVRKTGIVVVPGSGFKQEPGTFHFRTTFLPPESSLDSVIKAFRVFHESFTKTHA